MTAYDEVLYPTHAFSHTHPDRLATVARLHGMRPADPRRCRVLEIGCGSGGNLVPMASELPRSRFLGIDLAARPVAEGGGLIAEAGLRNVELRCQDIMEFPADAGPFDYVVAHGVYSWVPAEVRDRLLAVVRAHLAPQGVALVSYNAYPGGHLRDMLREMMLFHVRDLADPQRRIAQARALLKFLADAQTGEDHYAQLLRLELERVSEFAPEHLYHDDLAEVNEHFYFTQFADHAARHGLQYLSDAFYHRAHTRWRAPGEADPLADLADSPLLKEQYGDFLNCRRFRNTLLCRDDVALERRQRPEQMRQFYFAARVRPVPADADAAGAPQAAAPGDAHTEPRDDAKAGAPDDPFADQFAGVRAEARTEAPLRFSGMEEIKLEIKLPVAKAALIRLGECWPRAVPFDELLDAARALLGRAGAGEGGGGDGASAPSREEEAEALCRFLLTTYAAGFLEAHAYAADFVTEVSERPAVTALARAQARRETLVTNLRHVNLRAEDAVTRRLLQLLDGTRDRAALLSELKAFVESGEAAEGEGGQAAAREAFASLADQLEANLARLAGNAMFVS